MDNAEVRLVSGKDIVSLEQEGLAALRGRSRQVVVDVGTGDARMAYRLAQAHPDWLVIGLDPNWRGMIETAVRSRRKPARGGVPNLLLVAASIETPPEELAGIADEVRVLMPWGALLRGLVLGEPDVCGGLRQVARPAATVEVTVGTSIWSPPVPAGVRDLPELTADYVRDTLAPRWARAGLRITGTDLVRAEAAAGLATSWARRLGSGRTELLRQVTAVAASRTNPGPAVT